MSLLESTPTQYLKLPIKNPSKTRGVYVKYGYKIFAKTLMYDNKPPLLMFMGFTGTQYDWTDDFLSLLSKTRCVITVDHRGMGESHLIYDDKIQLTSHHKPRPETKRPIPSFSLFELAEDAYKLIKHLNIERVNICGISMGGYISQCFIIMYPEIIDNVILLATAPMTPTKAPYQNIDGNKHLLQGLRERNKIKNKKDLRNHLRRTWIIDSGGDINNLDMDKLEIYIDYAMNIKRPFKTIMGQLKAMEQWNGIQNLSKIYNLSLKFGFSVTIIHGDKDLMINVKNAEYLNDKLPNSNLYIFKGEGHLLHVTKKGSIACSNVINQYLNGFNSKSKL